MRRRNKIKNPSAVAKAMLGEVPEPEPDDRLIISTVTSGDSIENSLRTLLRFTLLEQLYSG